MRYTLFNLVKRRPLDKAASYLPLYKSKVFNGTDLEANLANSNSAQRFREYFPFTLLAQTDNFKGKLLVTQMHFNPDTQSLKLTSLHARGFLTQQFSLTNIIPITYADMRAYNRRPQPILPTYIDDTMTYFNKFNHDMYLFEFDGEWNQDTVAHPKLSLEATLDQKEWFDRRHAYL